MCFEFKYIFLSKLLIKYNNPTFEKWKIFTFQNYFGMKQKLALSINQKSIWKRTKFDKNV